MRIVLASANPKKAVELQELLDGSGLDLQVVPRPPDLPVPDEDEPDFLGNARIKAAAVSAATGEWAIADDSGLMVDALDGDPGVRSARYAGEHATDDENVDLLLARLAEAGATSPDGRSARFRCTVVVRSPDGRELVADGTVEGRVIEARRGTGGFGYDPVFVPAEGDGRTFGEMAADEKHAISHRGRALRALVPQLADLD
ncbi:RdgB/HAM1 family non-canonical purine NTP pyrophosphatase [Dermatobacter hominis]|uniref:RdgB/HAM1 family non-canonical purine NTP pyrophosphatase n=1 Tax=Dermatobacter hominis TaxID=2884263 RepID=UPI001D103490|nr:RdgB/HAM1 family non-canonical purine NTP pyrophosphatase [Dermatobacter hominis]UDY35651.1 RdgB/HAM1 family non-canonical purine NTP pyrophosphatase [Dermatobacter hominis]